MKILIAASAFKGTFSASQACDALAEGARAAASGAEVVLLPLADGGAGTLEAFLDARGGELVSVYVMGPRHGRIKASFAILEDGEAVLEIRRAAGLELVPHHARNPELTTSRGVGDLVVEALERGCARITLTLGDSATVDGGIGMAQALGFDVRDAKDLHIGDTGGVLREVTHVVRDTVHGGVEGTIFRALYDVDNPLLGPQGAAAVYGPQKGARPEQVDRLEEGLAQLAQVVERDLGVGPELREAAGAGAAGGLGWGCAAWLGAKLSSGSEEVLRLRGFEEALEGADLVLVGEGRYDAQSGMGKAPGRVRALASERKVPVVVVCGRGEGEGVWSAARLGEERAGTALDRADLTELARRAVSESA